jgi:hypothetical protein
MIQQVSTWATLAGTLATAIATIFLWRVTRVLAVETKRMADASARPQIVANIIMNQWAMNHVDLTIENTGNATAFDIVVEFDPPLENGKARSDGRAVPFQNISVLKPGQSLTSYLSESAPMMDSEYRVKTSWKVTPESAERQTLSYDFRMKDYAGLSRLGAASPAIQVAQELKKIRDDWRSIATGQKKIQADTYSEADRQMRERDGNQSKD